ncbi:STAS domain-containing protein [Streptomyces sp. NPDC005435]|uniref:STAS domain-containing protein n=1 Tax=Streptomyces sp. NPDC005435 TaxID=3154464 RepID=UPI0034556833
MSRSRPPGLPEVDPRTDHPVLVLRGPVTRDEVTGLSDEVRRLAGGSGVVVCDVGGLGRPPSLVHIELLARLELAACRAGGRIRLRGAVPALVALLGLVGLQVEVEGEVEEGEPAGGVQEAVETGDAAF